MMTMVRICKGLKVCAWAFYSFWTRCPRNTTENIPEKTTGQGFVNEFWVLSMWSPNLISCLEIVWDRCVSYFPECILKCFSYGQENTLRVGIINEEIGSGFLLLYVAQEAIWLDLDSSPLRPFHLIIEMIMENLVGILDHRTLAILSLWLLSLSVSVIFPRVRKGVLVIQVILYPVLHSRHLWSHRNVIIGDRSSIPKGGREKEP